jgi:hypothetical protein
VRAVDGCSSDPRTDQTSNKRDGGGGGGTYHFKTPHPGLLRVVCDAELAIGIDAEIGERHRMPLRLRLATCRTGK